MVQSPRVEAFFHPGSCTFSYVAWDPQTRRAVVIDSVLHYESASGRTSTHYLERIVRFVRDHDLQTDWILETHCHADHLAGGAHVQRALGGRTGIGAGIRDVQRHFAGVYGLERDFTPDGSQFDHLFEDGGAFDVGTIAARALATPGHTPDHVAYLIGDAVFVGDSLFMPDSGTARCDFPGGDAATLYRSIQRLFQLPDETRLFVLHDYAPGGREYRNETTIGAERRDNVHVGAGRSEAGFVELRTMRDATLSMPALIIPAIQVNIRAGELPPVDADGRRHLNIPLDRARDFSTVAGDEPPTP